MLVFPHEDQWDRATAAAAAIHEGLGARVGLASGEVLLGGGSVGGPLIARARAHAHEGGIAEIPARVPDERAQSPFVGRTREIELLRAARAALVIGPPGIGKSRLARELAHRQRSAFGRCSSYGARSLASLDEIAASLGASETLSDRWAAEVPLAFRKLCEGVKGPLLVVFDDVQWAEPLVLETIEHLVAQGPSRIQVLCLARDELLEEQPAFLPDAERLVLDALSGGESQALAEQLAADETVVRRALSAAEGNPLFIEQFVAHASEGGESLPPTLRALLAARLDRLSPSERTAIEHAAIIGREFESSLLGELVGGSQPLGSLVRRGFLEPAQSTTPFEERLRFRHALIQEAAYGASSKAERSRVHARIAELVADRASDETVGFHLERAAAFRPEQDERALELAEEAGRRLATAGLEAWRHGDARATVGLLERARALLRPDDAGLGDLLCELGVALNTVGEPNAAIDVLRQAEELGDRRVALRAQIEQAAISLLHDSKQAAAQLLEATEAARPVFEAVGDDRSLGRAWMLGGWVLGGAYGRHAAWEEAAERALTHYRRAGFPVSTCVGHIATALCQGPTPVEAGVARCTELLEREVADLVAEANVSAALGGLHAMAGDLAASTSLLDRARSIYTELGLTPSLLRSWGPNAARAAFVQGDAERAATLYGEICEQLTASRGNFHLATQAAEFAEVLLELERIEEAETWCACAERSARDDDLTGRIAALIPRSRLLALAERLEEAESVARDAVRLADETDELNLRAAALLALSDVLRSRGADETADAAGTAAVALYREKGNAAAVDRVNRRNTAARSPSPG